ncbi:hypothetical protein RFI_05772 [Reticulomyxa filosa]|uniref:Uncharacterized protein n=1 Tax=Reticulomyxa filosa TaxID=46433 RepID=X6NZG2_RETFI|nr:hypothetical protein RFI_05772 [Reticulomyxa filosa]|eukprot:ETO31351.1 hypothetical protein RFI_05772 [Reticulomyxa filosa]
MFNDMIDETELIEMKPPTSSNLESHPTAVRMPSKTESSGNGAVNAKQLALGDILASAHDISGASTPDHDPDERKSGLLPLSNIPSCCPNIYIYKYPDLRLKDEIWKELVTAVQTFVNTSNQNELPPSMHRQQSTQETDMLGEFYTQLSKRSTGVPKDLLSGLGKKTGGSLRNLLEPSNQNRSPSPSPSAALSDSSPFAKKEFESDLLDSLGRKTEKEKIHTTEEEMKELEKRKEGRHSNVSNLSVQHQFNNRQHERVSVLMANRQAKLIYKQKRKQMQETDYHADEKDTSPQVTYDYLRKDDAKKKVLRRQKSDSDTASNNPDDTFDVNKFKVDITNTFF